jgi:hypothetical protein
MQPSPWETVLPQPWHEPCLIDNHQFMKKFLLGLIAVAAVLLPLSQNAQAHWGYYHRYYGDHHAYWHHRYWYSGYWQRKGTNTIETTAKPSTRLTSLPPWWSPRLSRSR